MQNEVLHKRLYHRMKIDGSDYSKKAYERYDTLRVYKKLRSEGCSEHTSFEAIGMPKVTLFRLKRRYRKLGLQGLEDESKRPLKLRRPSWDRKTEEIVLSMRRTYPYGESKSLP